jgi:hypothetical protein
MEKEEIVYLSDLNLAEFTREMARWNSSSEIIEQDDIIIIKGADRSPITNVSMCLYREAVPKGEETLDRIASYYRPLNSSYSVHVRKHVDGNLDAACRAANLVLVADSPGMMVQDSIPEKPLPEGITIKPVTDALTANDFVSVVVDSYQSLGMPVEVATNIFRTPWRCLKPYNYLVVGYKGNVPSSCAMVMMSQSIAGVYWVGTIQGARGQGLAEACTRTVTNEALRRGAGCVVLQASQMGEPLYLRMGFKTITSYPWYMCLNK